MLVHGWRQFTIHCLVLVPCLVDGGGGRVIKTNFAAPGDHALLLSHTPSANALESFVRHRAISARATISARGDNQKIAISVFLRAYIILITWVKAGKRSRRRRTRMNSRRTRTNSRRTRKG